VTGRKSELPCRLYFLLAREAPVGVLFRRGPSKWVQLIRWDTASDRFEPGQWFHGHIYEERCDLSPDGRLLIYFASKFSRRTIEDREYTYAWTAISKPPWLTALALWPKGDCWHGGGLFETNRRLWLNHRPAAAKPHPDHLPRRLEVVPNPHAYGEDAPVLFRRLERDGWREIKSMEGCYPRSGFRPQLQALLADRGSLAKASRARIIEQVLPEITHNSGYLTERPAVLEKPHPTGSLSLLMAYAVFGACAGFDFQLKGELLKAQVPVEGAEWADWDHRGRLVYVSGGKLFAAEISGPGPLNPRELADFNNARPEPMEAPDWAKEW